jgi:hypothetical protein
MISQRPGHTVVVRRPGRELMAEKSLQERLQALPRCLRIAFAVRCARRVQPLTILLSSDRVISIDYCLTEAEKAAGTVECLSMVVPSRHHSEVPVSVADALNCACAAVETSDLDDEKSTQAAYESAGLLRSASVHIAYDTDCDVSSAIAYSRAANFADLAILEPVSKPVCRAFKRVAAGWSFSTTV